MVSKDFIPKIILYFIFISIDYKKIIIITWLKLAKENLNLVQELLV